MQDRKNGDSGTRTRDLCVANAPLSQLSYIPISGLYHCRKKKTRKNGDRYTVILKWKRTRGMETI